MRRNPRLLLVLLLLAALVLAACGGGDGDEATATATATATDEAVATDEATEEVAMEATEEVAMEATEEVAMEATEEATVAETVVASDFTILTAALDAAGLTETLAGEGPFTVFAPTDAAFEAAFEALGVSAEDLLADTDTLTSVLLYHVAEGAVLSSDLEDGQTITTLNGADITVSVSDEGVMLNGVANVVLADVTASNGVIHAIDAVLLPPEMMSTPMEATEEMASTEEATMEATEEAAMESATEVAMAATDMPMMEATEEMATMEATEEMAMTEATMEATEEMAAGAMSISTACMVTDSGGVTDGTFNQLAFDGMTRASEDFGFEATVIESNSAADFEPNINTCLAGDYDVILTIGFLLTDATLAAAEANPDVYFIGIDQFFAEPPANLTGMQTREDQSGFLVGAMAALVSESGTIAGVYGIEIPPVVKFRNGFEQGALYINPDINLLGVYIDSFDAADRGADAAEQFIGEGADVIFGAGGPTGSGGITYAAGQGVKVIGVDQDEYVTTFGNGESPGAENIISSAVKRIDVGVYNLLAALAGSEDFEWTGGGLYILQASNDGVGFAPAHDADVPEEVTTQIEEIFEMLKSGELETNVDPGSGALLDTALVPAAAEEAVPTEEATMEATEEAAMESATEVAMAATDMPTMEATEEMAMMEATEEMAMTEATMEATEEMAAGAMSISTACMVTDSGGVTDGTFNQLAFDGMTRASEDFGFEATVIESNSAADFEPNINTCLAGGYDVILTIGFLLTDATLAAAEANPDVYFIGVDQFFAEPPANLTGMQTREDQAGFLVGAMAALLSESGTIAGVYGIEIPPVVKYRNGYEQGALYINPDINLLGVYIDDFNAADRGADAAEQFIGEGADVIFGAGGPTGSGGITYAAGEGIKVIGVDQDEYVTTFGNGESPGAENIITSSLKRIDVGVYNLLAALTGAEDFEWTGGGLYILQASNDGIGFAPAHDATVPDEVTAQIEEILAMLKSGDLDTGVDPLSGALMSAESGTAATPEVTPEGTAEIQTGPGG